MIEICSIEIVNALLATGLAVVVALLCSRIRRPAIRHLLWVLVLLRLLAPPLCVIDLSQQQAWLHHAIAQRAAVHQAELRFTWQVHLNAIKKAAAEHSAVVPIRSLYSSTAEEDSSTFEDPSAALLGPMLTGSRFDMSGYLQHAWKSLLALLLVAWVLGSVACFAQQLLFVFQFRKRVYSNSYRSRIWQRRANKLAMKMGLHASPVILLVREPISPMLWGLGRRVQILIPDRLFEQLDRRGQNALLCHELAHYRRGDHWIRLLETTAMIVYWWHPVLWWVRHEVEKTEEQCCDAIAVEQCYGHRRVYAEALLAAVDFVSAGTLPPTASGAVRNGLLRQRIQQIMLGRRGLATQPKLGPIVALICAAILLPFPTIFDDEAAGARAAANRIAKIGPSFVTTSTSKQNAIPESTSSQVATRPARNQWELETDACHRTVLRAKDGSTVDIGVGRVATSAWSESKEQIAIGTTDGAVELRSTVSGQKLFEVSCGHAAISNLVFSGDLHHLAVANRSGELTIVAAKDGSKLFSVRKRNARVVKMSIDQEQTCRVVWSTQASIYEESWNFVDGRWIAERR